MGLFIAHVIVGTVYLANEGLISDVLAMFVLSWIIGITLAVFDVLLINLIGLHVYLISVDMTTY